MYNGGGNVNATLTGVERFNEALGENVSEANIKYVGRDGTALAETPTAPSAIGKYTAKIVVGNNVALVHYEITPHKHTFAYSLNNDKDTITATCNVIGCHLPDKRAVQPPDPRKIHLYSKVKPLARLSRGSFYE